MMKKRFLNLLCIGCIACAFAACSDDDKSDIIEPSGNGKGDSVENGLVAIQIKEAIPGSYAADPDTENATTGESNITKNVRVFIFDDSHLFEKSVPLTMNQQGGSDTWKSQQFRVTTGDKYFYVFANTPTEMSDPNIGSTRNAFEKTVLSSGYQVADITVNNAFTMASFAAVKEEILQTDDDTNPQTVELSVGRLSAKVTVKNNSTVKMGEYLKGTFGLDNGTFRLLNQSNNYYRIPQTSNGFNIQGSQTYSPFYDAYSAANYYNSTGTAWANAKSVNTGIIYTLENTNAVPLNQSGTSAEIMYVYNPAKEETYDVNNPTETVQLTPGSTFWIGVDDENNKLIYNADPMGVVAGVVKSYKYENGECYYIVPIADKSELTASLKYAVLRNHYYELTVNSISKLGNHEPGDIPDPERPIDDDSLIDVDIKVLPWFKITQDVDL